MDSSPVKPAHLEMQTIVSYPPSFYLRYFGWPTVARQEDGTLALAASGFRHGHMCPWGKSVLWESHDEGTSWEEIVLDDAEPSGDLGYPASVELSDGSIYTVFYRDGDLLSIKWKLN